MIKVLLNNSQDLQVFSVQEFESIFKMHWYPRIKFQSEKVFHHVVRYSTKALKKGELDIRKKWLGTHYAQELERGFMPNISIRWIDETFGFGVFAEEDLPKGTYIGEYTGVIRKRIKRKDKKNFYIFEYTIGMWLQNPYIIDAEKQGNHTRFINHSDEENLESLSVYSHETSHIVFITKKLIHKGDQLCYHYGDYFWTKRHPPKNLLS